MCGGEEYKQGNRVKLSKSGKFDFMPQSLWKKNPKQTTNQKTKQNKTKENQTK